MNMFGLPDEVMDAIMRSAIRSQMSGNSRNPFEKPQEVQKPKKAICTQNYKKRKVNNHG